MENNIRVGIIGSGYIADFHAKAVQTIMGMELSGVVCPNRDKAARFASRYNIESIFLKMSGLWLKQGANMGNMERMDSLFVFPPVRLEDLSHSG